jgi:hypothetical protein
MSFRYDLALRQDQLHRVQAPQQSLLNGDGGAISNPAARAGLCPEDKGAF